MSKQKPHNLRGKPMETILQCTLKYQATVLPKDRMADTFFTG